MSEWVSASGYFYFPRLTQYTYFAPWVARMYVFNLRGIQAQANNFILCFNLRIKQQTNVIRFGIFLKWSF